MNKFSAPLVLLLIALVISGCGTSVIDSGVEADDQGTGEPSVSESEGVDVSEKTTSSEGTEVDQDSMTLGDPFESGDADGSSSETETDSTSEMENLEVDKTAEYKDALIDLLEFQIGGYDELIAYGSELKTVMQDRQEYTQLVVDLSQSYLADPNVYHDELVDETFETRKELFQNESNQISVWIELLDQNSAILDDHVSVTIPSRIEYMSSYEGHITQDAFSNSFKLFENEYEAAWNIVFDGYNEISGKFIENTSANNGTDENLLAAVSDYVTSMEYYAQLNDSIDALQQEIQTSVTHIQSNFSLSPITCYIDESLFLTRVTCY